MKIINMSILLSILMIMLYRTSSEAHFGMIIPSDDIVSKRDSKTIILDIKFMHPFEGHYLDMDKPEAFGVFIRGKKHDLIKTLKKKTIDGFTTWQTRYRIKRPGDLIFYVKPSPYWEPTEEIFIVHYTKVIVNALGLEEGWDAEIGLPVEIVPLSRPYGLWTGNVFQGIVKVNGKPLPFAEVEVEYYNEKGDIRPTAEPYITQVIRADRNGVFTYAMPRAGWWGFAALTTATYKLKYKGNEYPVELGGVIWVRVRDMK